MENLPQEQRKQRLIQPKPSEKGEIITYLSRMGDVLHDVQKRSEVIVLRGGAVHIVVDSYETNALLREKNLRVIADLQVISAKTTKEQSITDLSSTDSIPFHSLNPLPFAHGEAATPPERKRTEAKSNSAVEIYREIIKDNIEYDHLIQNCKIDKDRLDEIVDLMLETVCTARKTIRIAGDDYPAELVKSKFLKLNSSHIEFVLDCMRENTTKVRNIKQYLKAVLFNAPSTIDSYYTALVNHDFYGSK